MSVLSADTTRINQQRQPLDPDQSVWLFGYGSLIYKVDFPYGERRVAAITGWERRFWQGSHDHRGTPQAPGRVVTLIAAAPEVRCIGMAYRVSGRTFKQLDYREKNGYLRFRTTLHFTDGTHVQGLVYIATRDNPAWLGPASDAAIARQIAQSSGPSGSNSEYLIQLARALDHLQARDAHVEALYAQWQALHTQSAPS